MKKFTVIQISDETKNGNVILKLQHKVVVDLGFAKKSKSETYYIAVAVDDNSAKENDVVNLDLAMFEVVERPFELDGEEIMLKWLHLV